MRKCGSVLILVLTACMMAGSLITADGPPPWAYGFTAPPPPSTSNPTAPAPGAQPGGQPAADDGTLRRLPKSTQAFTLAQIRSQFEIADWYPSDHPQMPDVVWRGRRPDVRACGFCHYPNGRGRPENSSVSGLPYSYFVQQIADFRNGDRKSADPRKANTNMMISIAKAMTDGEVKSAAEYFGSMKWTAPWISVVETSVVPRTRIAGGMFVPLEDGGSEPIGQRIIEVPEYPEGTEIRDAGSGFIAYVPVGSIKKGEALVTTGGEGRTTQCAVCHGADLKGLGPVPSIAGRSPSYAVRQLYDMQQGFRKGMWTDLMRPVVAKLTEEDMLAIASYIASRNP